MLLPILILLWHGAAVTTDAVAARQWSDLRPLAESYGLDIDKATAPIPVVPAKENFMAQPWLKDSLAAADSDRRKRLSDFSGKVPGKAITGSLHALDSGEPTRLGALLSTIKKRAPEYLPPSSGSKNADTALTLLRLTENLDIPWSTFEKAATFLPSSQVPPLGSLPALDDTMPASLSGITSTSVIHLMRVASLRVHAALALKKPDIARGSLEIQNQVIKGYIERPTMLTAMVGTTFMQSMIFQIHEGFQSGQWRETDIEWFAQWADGISHEKILIDASCMECVFTIRYFEGFKTDPGFEDRMVRHSLQNPITRDLLSTSGIPFRQEWLSIFRGNSELLYRLTPPGVFTLQEIAGVKTYLDDYLLLLRNGGLREYAWPSEEKRANSEMVSYARLGANFAAGQSRVNLLRTACALREWLARNGDYPVRLEDLRPSLPASASLDVCSGQPLRYVRVSKTTYHLYSVGTDRTDDGGKPVVDGKGDLVWQ